MTDRYPYDPGAFARVWKQLWALVPSYYRVLDGGEHLDIDVTSREIAAGTLVGPYDLRRLLGALAAPLASVRQSIEELHRDLFIDSAGDGAIALLADMVGTTLVFPDARSNRRDVRGTVGWRRRKGTPAMLEDLVDDLSGRMTPLLEGWKLLAITQDLDLLRIPRTTIDLRDLRVAERTRGPLDATHHVVDLRQPGATTGRYHPAHLSHWLHVTELFPVARAEAAYLGDQGDPITGTVNPPAAPPLDREWRYAMHPLGRTYPLRARRVGDADDLRSDRVPAMHFAHDPGEYFAREGRFAVEILGVPAAIGAPGELADPLRSLASADLLDGPHTLELLDRPRRSDDATLISLFAVAVAGAPPIASGAQTEIARATLASGTLGVTTAVAPPPGGPIATMLRLAPASGAPGGFFAGGTFALTAGSPTRWRAPVAGSTIDAGELARRGQLRGAVVFRIPPLWITSERWFYLGADGTLGNAQVDGVGPIGIALDPDGRIELADVASGGIGSAWPPHSLAAEREPTRALVPAPGTGPVRMHGGPLLDPAAAAPHLPARIVFAIATTEVTTTFAPVGALIVGAPAASDRGRWDILDAAGVAITSAAAALGRLRDLAILVANAREGTQELMFRLECATAGAVLPPSEIVWPAADGEALLVHAAELVADQVAHPSWPSTDSVSGAYGIGRDGSTWLGQFVARYSLGGIAPLGPADTGPVLHRRRRARWRSLCPWRNEVPASGTRLAPTSAGVLDVDVEHGLFALALDEPPPPAPGSVPNVTVSYQQGASAHVGAQPAERSTLLRHLPEVATRIVSRSGVAGTGALPTTLATPRYTTLTAALAAIDADASRATIEVVEIADSAIYAAEAPAWPGTGGGGAPTRTLIIRAAENARPVLRLVGWSVAAGAGFERVVLRGLTLASSAPLVLAPPLVAPTVDPELRHATFSFVLSTIASEGLALHASEPTSGAHLVVDRAIAGPLALIDAGQIFVTRSITDRIVANRGTTNVDRATVFGAVDTNVLEASESIFTSVVTVLDRFHGCIRFSRVETGSMLPARHRIVEGVAVRFTSIDRNDAAYARLAEACDARVRFGAADGAEMGAFHDELWSVRREAVARRLTEYTPAGLVSGLIRMD